MADSDDEPSSDSAKEEAGDTEETVGNEMTDKPSDTDVVDEITDEAEDSKVDEASTEENERLNAEGKDEENTAS